SPGPTATFAASRTSTTNLPNLTRWARLFFPPLYVGQEWRAGLRDFLGVASSSCYDCTVVCDEEHALKWRIQKFSNFPVERMAGHAGLCRFPATAGPAIAHRGVGPELRIT